MVETPATSVMILFQSLAVILALLLSQGVELSAPPAVDVIERVERMWQPIIIDQFASHGEWGNMSVPLIEAVIAEESYGIQRIESYAGAIGLMQIVPEEWHPDEGLLRSSPEINIQTGMGMLSQTIRENNGNVFRALALYNCGKYRLADNECGESGGYAYALKVLAVICPQFANREYENTMKLGIFAAIGGQTRESLMTNCYGFEDYVKSPLQVWMERSTIIEWPHGESLNPNSSNGSDHTEDRGITPYCLIHPMR